MIDFGPYTKSIAFIKANPGTSGTMGLARFILSLWSDEAAYSLRECLWSLDSERTNWIKEMIEHFMKYGEDEYLRLAGHEVCKHYEHLWDVGYAGHEAKLTKIMTFAAKAEEIED